MAILKKILVLVLCGVVFLQLSGCSHEHEFGEWEIVQPATCLEDGLEQRSCTHRNCEETETQTIPATGHSYSGGKCTFCGTTINEIVGAYIMEHCDYADSNSYTIEREVVSTRENRSDGLFTITFDATTNNILMFYTNYIADDNYVFGVASIAVQIPSVPCNQYSYIFRRDDYFSSTWAQMEGDFAANELNSTNKLVYSSWRDNCDGRLLNAVGSSYLIEGGETLKTCIAAFEDFLEDAKLGVSSADWNFG